MTSQRLTRDVLARTARASTSVADMLRRLGLPATGEPATYLRRQLAHYGIDTTHFTGERPRGGVLDREQLVAAVGASASVAGVLRRLGLPDAGSTRALVRRSLARYGLSTAHFTGQAHFLGTVSPTRMSPAQILRASGPGAPRTMTRLLRRALDDIGVPHRCAECGTGETWQGRHLVLEIDHVNGDWRDNRRLNLRYLCPNCHSQTPTFANRRRTQSGSASTVE